MSLHSTRLRAHPFAQKEENERPRDLALDIVGAAVADWRRAQKRHQLAVERFEASPIGRTFQTGDKARYPELRQWERRVDYLFVQAERARDDVICAVLLMNGVLEHRAELDSLPADFPAAAVELKGIMYIVGPPADPDVDRKPVLIVLDRRRHEADWCGD